MSYRIDVHDANTCARLGYLRRVGEELTLVLPSKKFVLDCNKPPMLVDHPDEATPLLESFLAARKLHSGRTIRAMCAVAVAYEGQ